MVEHPAAQPAQRHDHPHRRGHDPLAQRRPRGLGPVRVPRPDRRRPSGRRRRLTRRHRRRPETAPRGGADTRCRLRRIPPRGPRDRMATVTDMPAEQGTSPTDDTGGDRGGRNAGGARGGAPQRVRPVARRPATPCSPRPRRCSLRTATTRRACPTSSRPPGWATAPSTSTSAADATSCSSSPARPPTTSRGDRGPDPRPRRPDPGRDLLVPVRPRRAPRAVQGLARGVDLRSRDRRDPPPRASPPHRSGAQGHRGRGNPTRRRSRDRRRCAHGHARGVRPAGFVEGDGPGRRAQDVVAASETISALWLAAVGLGPGASNP